MKGIMRSLSPKNCNQIAHGEKTIDVVKIKPIAEPPFKVYMYCANSGFVNKQRTIPKEPLFRKKHFNQIKYTTSVDLADKTLEGYELANGKVIGEYVCDKIINYDVSVIACAKWEVNGADVQEELRYNAGTCLTAEEMFEYSKGKSLYGLHISQLKIYDKPKELGEFRKPCDDKWQYCQACKYGVVVLSPDEEEFAMYHGGSYETFDTVCCNYVKRPPQSWCYVEEQDDDKTRN